MSYLRRLLPLCLLVLLALGAAPAIAEITNCTPITSLPFVISTPGVYCLTGDLSTSMTSGNAIDIQASSVTLDLNGHKLGGMGAGTGTQAYGIYASDRKNITIRNGSIRGFFWGICLNDSGSDISSGHLIEQLRMDTNTYGAMWINGAGSIVQNNQVVNTGGTTHFGSYAEADGIVLRGAGVSALNNTISNLTPTGNAPSIGLSLASAKGATAEGNRISNETRPTGTSYGIYVGGSPCSTEVFAVNNRISNFAAGVWWSCGSGKYRDNLTYDVDSPYGNGTDAGNNH
jgi:hypothetical protein